MSAGENDPERRTRGTPPSFFFREAFNNPALNLAIAVVLIAAALLLIKGSVAMGQATLNGSYRPAITRSARSG